MNIFTNLKSMKKLFLMGACGGAIVSLCSYIKKPYVGMLGAFMAGHLIRAGYELGLQDGHEKEMNDLKDILTTISEEFKTEETE